MFGKRSEHKSDYKFEKLALVIVQVSVIGIY